MVTFAAFRITKPSGWLYGNVFSVDSARRNQGIELTVLGEPCEGVRLVGGSTYLQAVVVRSR